MFRAVLIGGSEFHPAERTWGMRFDFRHAGIIARLSRHFAPQKHRTE